MIRTFWRFLSLVLIAWFPCSAMAGNEAQPKDMVLLESVDQPGLFIRILNSSLSLTALSSEQDKLDATFFMIAPLNGKNARTSASFRSAGLPDYYIKDIGGFAGIGTANGGEFPDRASFIRTKKSGAGTAFESAKSPGRYIQHVGSTLILNQYDNAKDVRGSFTFQIRKPSDVKVAAPSPQDVPDVGDDGDTGDDGGTARTVADTTVYQVRGQDDPDTNQYLGAGDTVTIVSCGQDNWCKISSPFKGWVWGDDLNH